MDDDRLRSALRDLLQQGLVTEVEPRAYSSDEVQRVVARLQTVSPDDISAKLAIAGFTLVPYAPSDSDDGLTQSCETCMYYGVHNRSCDLPELQVPVEKEWSCRLWRI